MLRAKKGKQNSSLILILHEKKFKSKGKNIEISWNFLTFPRDIMSTWNLHRPLFHPSSPPYLKSPLAYRGISATWRHACSRQINQKSFHHTFPSSVQERSAFAKKMLSPSSQPTQCFPQHTVSHHRLVGISDSCVPQSVVCKKHNHLKLLCSFM